MFFNEINLTSSTRLYFTWTFYHMFTVQQVCPYMTSHYQYDASIAFTY